MYAISKSCCEGDFEVFLFEFLRIITLFFAFSSLSSYAQTPSPSKNQPKKVISSFQDELNDPTPIMSPQSTALLNHVVGRTQRAINMIKRLMIIFFLIMMGSLYVIFNKFGYKGHLGLLPFYNLYILTKIINRPAYWVALWCLPLLINVFLLLFPNQASNVSLITTPISLVSVAYQMRACDLLRRLFGKGRRFALGLIFIPFIFFPLLASSNPVVEK